METLEQIGTITSNLTGIVLGLFILAFTAGILALVVVQVGSLFLKKKMAAS
ncbi:MAG TPA: hypothetical protein VII99_17070 [Bacteroidia bacterium]